MVKQFNANYRRNEKLIEDGYVPEPGSEVISVPAPSSEDTDKVLTVLENGEAGWRNSGASAQEQADWTESDDTKPSFIKHKPTLSTVATSGSYNDLSDKPTIPSGTELVPTTSGANNGDVLTNVSGTPTWDEPVKELPAIASGDAGKVLAVNAGEDAYELAAKPLRRVITQITTLEELFAALNSASLFDKIAGTGITKSNGDNVSQFCFTKTYTSWWVGEAISMVIGSTTYKISGGFVLEPTQIKFRVITAFTSYTEMIIQDTDTITFTNVYWCHYE